MATAERLGAFGTCIAMPVKGDIATTEGRDAIVAEMRRREAKLDVLVNNAGALWAAPLAEYPESGWDKVFDLNVKGLFFLIRDLVPMLEAAARKTDPARVINIGSIDGFHIPNTRPMPIRHPKRLPTSCRSISPISSRAVTSPSMSSRRACSLRK